MDTDEQKSRRGLPMPEKKPRSGTCAGADPSGTCEQQKESQRSLVGAQQGMGIPGQYSGKKRA